MKQNQFFQLPVFLYNSTWNFTLKNHFFQIQQALPFQSTFSKRKIKLVSPYQYIIIPQIKAGLQYKQQRQLRPTVLKREVV